MSKARIGAVILSGAAALVAAWEGYKATTYRDPVGILTACYGHTGPELRMGQTFTQNECNAYLEADLKTATAAVDRLVKVKLSTNERNALISFVYNVGEGNFASSTLLKKLNAGDRKGASNEFGRWVNAKGVRLQGLVNRRAAERDLFLKE